MTKKLFCTKKSGSFSCSSAPWRWTCGSKKVNWSTQKKVIALKQHGSWDTGELFAIDCPLSVPVSCVWLFTWPNHTLHSYWHRYLSENIAKIVMLGPPEELGSPFAPQQCSLWTLWPLTILFTYGVAKDLRHMETKPNMKDYLQLKHLLRWKTCLKDWDVVAIPAYGPRQPGVSLDDQRHR